MTGPKRSQAKVESVDERHVVLDSHRVAVLPFASMSPNPNDEYFADGMTEEVISTLSRVPDIEVISRTSVMHYKKNPKPIKEVSKELDVGTILEGSVRKAGNRLRITIQMIDASRDRHLWAESYDRELQDIFAIQSEVATRVAEAPTIKPIHGKDASPRKKPTTNTEAYTLYLKGRYYWNKRGPENIKTALDFFERAVKEDPRFALGYVGLADCRMILSSMLIDWKANQEKSKAMLSKALELEPELAEAHASNGLALLSEFRFREAEEQFRKALELNPSYAPAHLWYSHLLRAELRLKEALEQLERAIALDPLSANMYTNLGGHYYDMEDYRTALDFYKRGAELDPSYAVAHLWAGHMYGKMKMFSDARHEYGIAVQLLQQTYPHVGKLVETRLAYMEDDRARVRRLLPKIEANAKEGFADATEIAVLYFYLGEDDKGFGLLDQAYSSGEYSLIFVQCDPEIPDRVRTDPRYSKLLKRLGLEQVSAS